MVLFKVTIIFTLPKSMVNFLFYLEFSLDIYKVIVPPFKFLALWQPLPCFQSPTITLPANLGVSMALSLALSSSFLTFYPQCNSHPILTWKTPLTFIILLHLFSHGHTRISNCLSNISTYMQMTFQMERDQIRIRASHSHFPYSRTLFFAAIPCSVMGPQHHPLLKSMM